MAYRERELTMPLNFSRLSSLAKLKNRLPFPKLGVRGLVIGQNGEILLVRHTYIAGWYLPGGGVEKGESSEISLVRELAEEANIEVIGRPQLHGLFFNPKGSSRDHVACYIVREFRQTRPYRSNFEIAEAKFFAPDALPKETTRATRTRIEEVIKGSPAASIW
jgi:8-oxo-dGTP pyrophosphatase MutT (NUDIX family)